MTVIAQDDHFTAGAWAACGCTKEIKNSPSALLSYLSTQEFNPNPNP